MSWMSISSVSGNFVHLTWLLPRKSCRPPIILTLASSIFLLRVFGPSASSAFPSPKSQAVSVLALFPWRMEKEGISRHLMAQVASLQGAPSASPSLFLGGLVTHGGVSRCPALDILITLSLEGQVGWAVGLKPQKG